MSEANHNPPPAGGNPGGPPNDPSFVSGELHHPQVSARVPENVARGVFSTGAIVMSGNSEFILDFVLRMSRPHQVTARVVVPVAVLPQIVGALRENMARYTESFGPIKDMPKPPAEARNMSIQEVYDELKIPDDALSGVYANGVMIGHSPAEFCFDFFTNFYPRSSVSCRVFLSAPQVPRFLDALVRTYQDFQRRVAAAQAQQQQAHPPSAPPAQTHPPLPPTPPGPDLDKPLGDQGKPS